MALLILAGSAAAQQTVFQDDFNDGTIDPRWSWNGASEDDRCGASSPPRALVFSYDSWRSAWTPPLDLTGGAAVVAFDLTFGTGGGSCVGGDPSDEVTLAYSTDGGSTWTTLSSYHPSDPSFAGTWSHVTAVLPAEARTQDVSILWTEGGNLGPMWALDDVEITVCPGAGAHRGPVSVSGSSSGEVCAFVEQQEGAQTVPSQDLDTPGVPSQDVSTPGVPSRSIDTPRVPSQDVTTPRVPSQTAETPAVVVPEACTPGDVVCTERTEVLPAQEEETPEVPSQQVETPAVPSQHIGETPTVPSQHVGETPAVPSQHVETPGIGVQAHADGSASADSGRDESSTIGPIDPDPVPIVICASGCDVPVDPKAHAGADAGAKVTVGEESLTVGTP